MRTPRFRLRTLMIGIAVLSPVLAILALVLRVSWALEAFYGPGGYLDRRQKFGQEGSTGDEACRLGHYIEAEARYRSALDFEASLPDHENDLSYILVGLADALVGQGSYSDAEPLYQRALKIREQGIRSDPRSWRWAQLKIAEVLDHYASLLRHCNGPAEAETLEGRAKTIRAEWEHQKVEE